jgi:hypothetical protein
LPNLLDRVAASLGFVRSRKTEQSYGRGPYARYRVQVGFDPRRGAEMMRNYSRNNPFVRLAIDYRREQISQAGWKIVRLDDPEKPPDKAVVTKVRALFADVNPTRESLETLFDEIIDDVLVLDAGCIEKEKSIGGEISALWPVDGSTIVPDSSWDGSNPKAIRYRQVIDGHEVAQLRNDQLLYIMRTPTTYSADGWSPVQTLVRVIEAILYCEQYDFEMLKQTAPAGALDLGNSLTVQQVEQYREYYENEIAGSKDIAIFGGGEPGPGATGVTWTPFGRSNRDQEHSGYREWNVKLVASVFRIDKSIFNITDQINRATSRTQQTRTDEGLKSLASTLARYITREIVWEIDRDHAFVFDQLSDRDEAQDAEIYSTYVGSGILTINEVRAEKWGKGPLPWGDDPWVPNTGPVDPEPADPNDPPEEEDGDKPQPGDDDKNKSRSAKRIAPFVAAAAAAGARMRQQRLDYLNALDGSSQTNVNV